MTYGVDECRVCGKPMAPSGPEAMRRHLASQTQRPTMTEKQWRAAGFKAMPTKREMISLHHGCCYDCMMKMGIKGVGQKRWILPALVIAILFMLLMFFLGSTYT